MTRHEYQSQREALFTSRKMRQKQINLLLESNKQALQRHRNVRLQAEQQTFRSILAPLYDERRIIRSDINEARRIGDKQALETLNAKIAENTSLISQTNDAHIDRVINIEKDIQNQERLFIIEKVVEMREIENEFQKEMTKLDKLMAEGGEV